MAKFLRALLCIAMLTAFFGCGNDDDDTDKPASPGKISVSAEGITGYNAENPAYFFIVTVTPTNKADALGAFCATITSDPFSSGNAVIQEPPAEGTDICEGTNAEKTFDAGDYNVNFSIVKAGAKGAEKTATVKATVDGDVTVKAPTFSEWE